MHNPYCLSILGKNLEKIPHLSMIHTEHVSKIEISALQTDNLL